MWARVSARASVRWFAFATASVAVLTVAGCAAPADQVAFSLEPVSETWPAAAEPDRPIAMWTDPGAAVVVFVMQGFEEDCPIATESVTAPSPPQVLVVLAEAPMPCAAVGSLLQVSFEIPDVIDPALLDIVVQYPSGRQISAEFA